MNRLWFIYLKGRGVAVDAKRGVSYFEKAANVGDAVGLYNLANAWSNGEGVPRKDDEKEFGLYRRASDAGDVDSVFSVAMCFATGAGVKTDMRAAVEWMQRAANLNSASAWFKLGEWYENGVVPPLEGKDLSKSMDAFRKSMVAGSKNAEGEYRRLILQTLPKSVKRGTKKQVAQYVQDIIDGGSTKWARAKVMVLGKEGIGKTHLYHRIRNQSYDVNLSTMESMCTRFT